MDKTLIIKLNDDNYVNITKESIIKTEKLQDINFTKCIIDKFLERTTFKEIFDKEIQRI